MRSAFIAVLLILTPFANIAQDSPLRPDGRMWQTWTNFGSESLFIKAAYLQGAIEGLGAGALTGYLHGRSDEANDALDYMKPCLDKGPCAGIPLAMLIKPVTNSTTNAMMAGADKVLERFKPQNASTLDIVHQMDKFYGDYRNTPVCIIQAVQESIRSLNGTGSSEKELEMLRKGCNT